MYSYEPDFVQEKYGVEYGGINVTSCAETNTARQVSSEAMNMYNQFQQEYDFSIQNNPSFLAPTYLPPRPGVLREGLPVLLAYQEENSVPVISDDVFVVSELVSSSQIFVGKDMTIKLELLDEASDAEFKGRCQFAPNPNFVESTVREIESTFEDTHIPQVQQRSEVYTIVSVVPDSVFLELSD